MDNVSVGKYICELRKKKGWTQKELADKLNITDKAISKWETGRGAPDISNFIPLSELLGVSVYELLTCGNTEKDTGQVDKVIIETVNETKQQGHRNLIKAVIAVIVAIALLLSGLYAFWYSYWGNRHKFLCDIDTVYLTKIADDHYEYEINGNVRNWAINNGISTFKYYSYLSGMPDYIFTGESDFILLNGHEKTKLIIKGELYTNDDVISDFQHLRYKAYTTFGNDKYVEIEGAELFMADYSDINYVFK